MQYHKATAAAMVLLTNLVLATGQICPPCVKNANPLPGGGPASNLPPDRYTLCGCPDDDRRVITVYITGSWDVDPAGNSTPGNTNVHVWNAVNCAIAGWNSAKDQFENKTGYFFVLDQSGQFGPPEVKVKNESGLGGSGWAETTFVGTAPNYTKPTIKLDPRSGHLNNNQMSSNDLCGRMKHEIGHIVGLSDDINCASIMQGSFPNGTRNPVGNIISQDDVLQSNNNLRDDTRPACQACAAGTTCEPPSGGGGCNPDTVCSYPYYFDPVACQCTNPYTPILIDVLGNGFDLTDAAGGVAFDFNADGVLEHTSWTAAGSDDSWLILDRNGNALVDSGKELFGSVTPQPVTSAPNGFIALAEYDKPANGGNGDGKITALDPIFSSLRLWQDLNHNGLSEASELRSLSEVGLAAIDLDYEESRRRDRHGNLLRYRAKVRDNRGAQLGRWAWDVFLVSTSL